MPDESIDYATIVEQLQKENERLRERLSSLKFRSVTWDTISQVILKLITDVHYVAGLCTGIFFVLLLLVFFGGNHGTT